MNSEEKIADGIYITKPKPKNDERKINDRKFVYRSTSELIAILEIEIEEYLREIEQLYNANEEMLEFDPNDYDLIQARGDNIVLINKRIMQIKNIQNELKVLCPTNPLVNLNIYEKFNQNEKNEFDIKEDIIKELEL